MRAPLGWACALIAVGTAHAVAQPSQSVAAAEQLFEDARVAATKGDFASACPRFEASYKLDPALGTLLNMATCYENLGQLASAWGRYREVVAVAMKAGDEERIKIARARADALEPRLPRLTIKTSATKVVGLVVTRDDLPVDPAVLGVGIYVDPGEHAVTATAAGHRPFNTRITIKEGEQKVLDLPALEIDPDRPAPIMPVGPSVTTIRVEEDSLDRGRSRRLLGMVLGGAGIATVAAGLGFGVAARSSWNAAFDDGLCERATLECSPAGQEQTSSARTSALVSNFVAGTGIAMIIGGGVLYFTAPRRTDVSITPVTGGGASVSIGGSW